MLGGDSPNSESLKTFLFAAPYFPFKLYFFPARIDLDL